MKRAAITTMLLAGALVIAACRPADSEAPATLARTGIAAAAADARHEAGRKIYNFRCYYCHGYSGDARTLATQLLTPAPRDFQAGDPAQLPRSMMLKAVRDGRAGTAMTSFAATLTEADIEAVVDFVREEFMVRKSANTRYHTAENGWPDHQRYQAAFAFANGEIALDRPWEELNAAQAAGKRLYLSACISCHDRANVTQLGEPWALRGVSYPPGNYEEDDDHDKSVTGHAGDDDDPYELHEAPPSLANLSPLEQTGARLFQANCAHCHAADGTGRNWIGSFLAPSPPDFTRAAVAPRLTRALVSAATRDGRPGTSMPAWKGVLRPPQIDAIAAYVERAWGPRTPRTAQVVAQDAR